MQRSTTNFAAHWTKAEILAGLPISTSGLNKALNGLIWDHFTPAELASRGNGELILNYKAAESLARLRFAWNRPLIIHSAYRDPIYNRRVGGAKNSLHMQGRAFDIGTKDWPTRTILFFVYQATKAGFTGFGYYPTFLHIDTGVPRTWQVGEGSNLADEDDNTEMPDGCSPYSKI